VGERAHTTAIRAAGNTFSITVNNSVLGVGVDCFASGIIAMYPEFGPNSGLTITGGLFIVSAQNDGAFGIAAGFTPPGEQPNRNFNVNGLWISTEFYASGCPSGCAQQWTELIGTNSWTNVKKYNPGQPITARSSSVTHGNHDCRHQRFYTGAASTSHRPVLGFTPSSVICWCWRSNRDRPSAPSGWTEHLSPQWRAVQVSILEQLWTSGRR
jgi:hypothetical protein